MTTTASPPTLRVVPDELITVMDAGEARECVAGIRADMENAAFSIASARRRVLDLDRRQGWRALGYDTLRDCLKAELAKSQAHVYRQLAAARVEEALGLPFGSQPEGRIRDLAQLEGEPPLQRFAWRIAELIADVEHGGKITGPVVKNAVDLVTEHPELAGISSDDETWAGEEAELFAEPEDHLDDAASDESGEWGNAVSSLDEPVAADDLTDGDVIASVEELLRDNTPNIKAALELVELAPSLEVQAKLKKQIAAKVQSVHARARVREADEMAVGELARLLDGIEDLPWDEQRARFKRTLEPLKNITHSEAVAQQQLRRAIAAIAGRAGDPELVNGFSITYDIAADEWCATEVACDVQLYDRTPDELMETVAAAALAIAEGWTVRLVRHDMRIAHYQLTRPDFGGITTDTGSNLASLLDYGRADLDDARETEARAQAEAAQRAQEAARAAPPPTEALTPSEAVQRPAQAAQDTAAASPAPAAHAPVADEAAAPSPAALAQAAQVASDPAARFDLAQQAGVSVEMPAADREAGLMRGARVVPHVLVIGKQPGPYALAPIQRAEVLYQTAATVRVRLADGTERNEPQEQAFCLVDDAAWLRTQAAYAAYATATEAVVAYLRGLGSYSTRLAEAGGTKKAPNPLTPTVAEILDPDQRSGYWNWDRWQLPTAARKAVERHTEQQLFIDVGTYAAPTTQANRFCCPDDAAYDGLVALLDALQARHNEWIDLLGILGSYENARDDRRYEQARPTVVETPGVLQRAYLLATLARRLSEQASALFDTVYWQARACGELDLSELDAALVDQLVEDVMRGSPITEAVYFLQHGVRVEG